MNSVFDSPDFVQVMMVEIARGRHQVDMVERKQWRKILFLAKDLGDKRQRGLKLQMVLRALKTHLTEIGF